MQGSSSNKPRAVPSTPGIVIHRSLRSLRTCSIVFSLTRYPCPKMGETNGPPATAQLFLFTVNGNAEALQREVNRIGNRVKVAPGEQQSNRSSIICLVSALSVAHYKRSRIAAAAKSAACYDDLTDEPSHPASAVTDIDGGIKSINSAFGQPCRSAVFLHRQVNCSGHSRRLGFSISVGRCGIAEIGRRTQGNSCIDCVVRSVELNRFEIIQRANSIIRICAAIVRTRLEDIIADGCLVFIGVNMVVAQGIYICAVRDPASYSARSYGRMAGRDPDRNRALKAGRRIDRRLVCPVLATRRSSQ